MRSGKKTSSSHLVGYRLIETDQPTRFGFVISKACGNAVRRNLLKRRLRSLAREKMNQFPSGSQLVIRGLPGSAEQQFSNLSEQFDKVLGLK
jgi:ribonuclease P protein component